jgi:hypothetical protein
VFRVNLGEYADTVRKVQLFCLCRDVMMSVDPELTCMIEQVICERIVEGG